MFYSRMQEENVGKYSECCLKNGGTSQKREFGALSVSYLNHWQTSKWLQEKIQY